MKLLIAFAIALTPAFAIAGAPAKKAAEAKPAGPDMSKMGPWSRKPSDVKKTTKEIMAFFKAQEEAHMKGDFNALLSHIDFPVYMATDSASGKHEGKAFSKEEYVAMMKPFMENMPKDMKMTHKPSVKVLSDSLVVFTDDFTMTMGKHTMTGTSGGLLVKGNGKWQWKMMVEAGWGGMPAPPKAKK